ncbi:NUDIX hydrolase [Streptomyces sp. 150FB]|uniref:NUDIX domain-containing protein n=1 Tax=Streptomyces sp. 150FB TaxID=1576605 RepID=UPI0006989102|nr:NUDIX hydrolase [Streptomyces sp. 150FB]
MTHAEIDSARPPRRRIGAVVLVRDVEGRVLLVKPTYRHADSASGWQLPGGGAHQGETVAGAAARELLEETGLVRRLTHFVALDYVPAAAEGKSAEGYNVVCDGGTLTAAEASGVAVPDSAADELSACAWVGLDELGAHCFAYQERRIRAAVDAVEHANELPLLVLGGPTIE